MFLGFAELLAEEMSPERALGYVEATRDLPLGALRLGLKLCARNARFFPKPAEIRDACEEIQNAERERRLLELHALKRQVPANLEPFGRMPKYVVERVVGSFVWPEKCGCMACWDAQPDGPARFIPDGTEPTECRHCLGTGFLVVAERSNTKQPGVTRCGCLMTPRDEHDPPPTDMGRWLHGADLVEHEQAQAAFMGALSDWARRHKMGPM